MNFIAVLVAAVVPMVIGMVWYNPKVLGKVWMRESELTEEKMKGGNMFVMFGTCVFLSFLLSMSLQFNVIHQLHITSAFFDFEKQIKDATTTEGAIYKSVMDLVGTGHRTFGHGMLHGCMTGLLFVMPVIGINSAFERKSFKYVAIHVGYWIITLGIMGGILSVWM
jgi:Protein of unknown function (DUF1761)